MRLPRNRRSVLAAEPGRYINRVARAFGLLASQGT